jgi:hypothetical protein
MTEEINNALDSKRYKKEPVWNMNFRANSKPLVKEI